MYKGNDTAPNITSANAMFITRSKLFLRNFFSSTKSKIVSEFLLTIKRGSITIALQIAISYVRKGRCMVDYEEVLVELAVVDVLFILELMMVFGWILWQSIHQRESPGTIYGKEFFLLDSLIPGRAIATS